MSDTPRVFTIPPGCPFLPTLVEALEAGRLVEGLGPDLAGLETATIYLPNRRAARALAALLAERGGGRARLLPRIVPLGEADEAEFELTGGAGGAFEKAETLAPPIPPLERRLILTRLIQAWVGAVDRNLLRLPADVPLLVPASPADAVSLAADLEALMDAFTTENVPWEDLAQAVDADFSTYFGVTLDFVRIAAEAWPKILTERGASDPARRRDALIGAEARRLLRERPTGPIVAAGSTGSIPATAGLLAAIAGLPNGAVVLPGLDTDLDEASWRLVGGLGDEGSDPVHGHPQAMLRRLVGSHLAMARDAVAVLGEASSEARARQKLLSEALRPADTTDRWAIIPQGERERLAQEGCAGLALVEAADEREEALAIAVALRETLAQPGRTAALVTPDRALAARVAAELARWGVQVDDSAGVALTATAGGRLARLAADAASQDFDPVRVLALLAHPDCRLGLPRGTVERAASALEIGVLRGPAPGPGLDGLRLALDEARGAQTRHTPRPRRRLSDEDWALASDLLDRLAAAFAGFSEAELPEGPADLVTLAARHRAVVERLRAAPEDEEATDEDGSAEALAALYDDLALSQTGGVLGRFVDYPLFFTTLARSRTLQPPARAGHRRVKILGLLEARLLSADRVVLGGLDEGVWPPRTEADAFLNRPMRAKVGLAPPERRIGQTAHDFVQALGVTDAVITRAHKRDGSPMVPSRFLQRLKAFVGPEPWGAMTGAGHRYRMLARLADERPPAPPLPRPAPKPSPDLFPRSLSVTEIETLIRDPYAIFARHVLGLDALPGIALPPGVAERGTLIHEILGGFAEDHPDAMPPNALVELISRGQNAFGPIEDAYPELYAEWWPRFERLAAAYVVWEEARRREIRTVHAERSGSLPLPLPDGGVFHLRARADRIEERRDGTFTVVDFKTGAPPGLKEVFAGFSPQLTLEAAMLMRGAFKGLKKAEETPGILYVQASGGREPLVPKEVTTPKAKDESRTVADVVAEHIAKLEGLVGRYASGEAAYVSRPYPKYAKKYSDYDHLARVKEWSLASGGEEGGDGA